MERSPAILIETVDVGAVHEELLNHANLTRELVEYSVVERGTACMVSHVDKIC